jgi:hypothetical protein
VVDFEYLAGRPKDEWAGFSGFVRTLFRVFHSVCDVLFE